MGDRATPRPLAAAGTVLGIGLGGLIDGVVLHQILQVHAMLSARLPPDTMANMRVNMTADGAFHAAMLLMVGIGLMMLFNAAKRRDARWSERILVGSMLTGWGVFNVIEGVVDHHILGLHHVVERLGLSLWDWVFLGGSVVLIVGGRMIAKDPAPDRH